MYKPISNPGNPPKKSVACDQVEKGKITDNQVDQLLCCSEISNSCSAYSSDCLGDDKRVAKCHNISSPSTFDACKRSDTRAARVCG
jgi:hypothetical protein